MLLLCSSSHDPVPGRQGLRWYHDREIHAVCTNGGGTRTGFFDLFHLLFWAIFLSCKLLMPVDISADGEGQEQPDRPIEAPCTPICRALELLIRVSVPASSSKGLRLPRPRAATKPVGGDLPRTTWEQMCS